MNEQYKKKIATLSYNQSLVLNHIQKAFNKTNNEMAKVLGYKAVRSWERAKSGRAILSYPLILQLQNYFCIEYIDLLNGRVSIDIEAKLFLPSKYSEIRGSGSDLVKAFVGYFINNLGEDHFRHFCYTEKVDRTYFVNENCSISILFIKRLLQELKHSQQTWNPIEISRVISSSVTHEDFKYFNSHEAFNFLDIGQYLQKFEKNNSFQTEAVNKKEIIISFTPLPHLGSDFYSGDFILNGDNEIMIMHNVGNILGLETNVLEQMSKGSSKCIASLSR